MIREKILFIIRVKKKNSREFRKKKFLRQSCITAYIIYAIKNKSFLNHDLDKLSEKTLKPEMKSLIFYFLWAGERVNRSEVSHKW